MSVPNLKLFRPRFQAHVHTQLKVLSTANWGTLAFVPMGEKPVMLMPSKLLLKPVRPSAAPSGELIGGVGDRLLKAVVAEAEIGNQRAAEDMDIIAHRVLGDQAVEGRVAQHRAERRLLGQASFE